MLIDLSYLKKNAGDDMNILREMAEIFIAQVQEISELMEIKLSEKDWQQLARLAHKAKSSVAVMGMENLAEQLKQLELCILNGTHQEQYDNYVSLFRRTCREAISELQKIIPDLPT